VQLYVRDAASSAFRPEKELKGFEKVFLQPGEEMRVAFTLDGRAFAYYNPLISGWHVESGEFEILVGASSADIRTRGKVWVESARPEAPLPDIRQIAPVYYHLPAGSLEIGDAEFRAVYGAELPARQPQPGEAFTRNTPLGELRGNLVGQGLYEQTRQGMLQSFGGLENETMRVMVEKMVEELPLRGLVMFGRGQFTFEMADGLLAQMNAMENRK
jgi:beta-glucosidase